jgi:hypothetical protein
MGIWIFGYAVIGCLAQGWYAERQIDVTAIERLIVMVLWPVFVVVQLWHRLH